jgi:hypothetical protein
MNPIDLNTTVVRSTNILASAVDNDLVMLDVEGGHYFSLDPIGADIWERLAEPVRVADLCEQLGQTYDVAPTVCHDDVLKLLNDMATDKLLVIVQP